MKPTLEQFKIWAQEHHAFALGVCRAQAFAELERKRVDAYVLPIFRQYEFRNDMTSKGGLITDPERLYLSRDEAQCAKYYAHCDHAHREHGFTGPAGHCPALEAENLLIQAQNALIEAAKPLFEVEIYQLHGAQRKRYLDLLLGACLKESKAA